MSVGYWISGSKTTSCSSNHNCSGSRVSLKVLRPSTAMLPNINASRFNEGRALNSSYHKVPINSFNHESLPVRAGCAFALEKVSAFELGRLIDRALKDSSPTQCGRNSCQRDLSNLSMSLPELQSSRTLFPANHSTNFSRSIEYNLH